MGTIVKDGVVDYILSGGIYIKPNFFKNKDFVGIKNELDTIPHEEMYQPEGTYYGNRFQAFPCYQINYENNYYSKIIHQELEKLIKDPILKLEIVSRKVLTDEVKQSKSYGPYANVHTDGLKDSVGTVIAGMMYFEQSFDGGTAFFEKMWDKVPDIYISAFPNRLVLYYGGRPHAPAIDYTFKERLTLSFFITVKDKKNNEK
jgi:hypothetical protein